MTIINERLDLVDTIKIGPGKHKSIDEGCCLTELCSWLAGEPFSDHPQCVSPVIAAFGRRFWDNVDDETRLRLRDVAPRLIGTRTNSADEDARSWLIANWSLHVSLPTWLDAAGMTEQAAEIRALPEITSWAAWTATGPTVRRVREAAWQLRNERWAPLRARIREAVIAKLTEEGSGNKTVADGGGDGVAVVAVVADAAVAVAAVAVAVAAVAVAVAVAADAADAADAVAVAAAVAGDAVAAPSLSYGDVYRAVKPIFAKAIEDHPSVGPVARSMKESGFELLEQLCEIGRVA